jgi:putative intracellular protease/amidase
MKRAVVYLHEGLMDWELGFILPELTDSHYRVETVAETRDLVSTQGGLKIVPDSTLDSLKLEGMEIIILPGGAGWKDLENHRRILDLLPQLKAQGVCIAAICDATLGLAKLGMLDSIAHTSNYLPALKAAVPEYKGGDFYQADQLAVGDEGIVTASGIGALEFARVILHELVAMTEEEIDEWYLFMKEGKMPVQFLGRGREKGQYSETFSNNRDEAPSPEQFGGP